MICIEFGDCKNWFEIMIELKLMMYNAIVKVIIINLNKYTFNNYD